MPRAGPGRAIATPGRAVERRAVPSPCRAVPWPSRAVRAMAVPCHGRAVPCRAMASLLDDACCAWHLWIIQSFRVLLWSFTCPPMDNSIFPMTIRSSGERLLHAQSVPHCAKCRAVPNPCRAKSVPCRAVPSPFRAKSVRAVPCRVHLVPCISVPCRAKIVRASVSVPCQSVPAMAKTWKHCNPMTLRVCCEADHCI